MELKIRAFEIQPLMRELMADALEAHATELDSDKEPGISLHRMANLLRNPGVSFSIVAPAVVPEVH